MKSLRLLSTLIFIVLLLLCSLSSAQRVGVVLSGGGARGVAHIGVLKALEELNIPIDYIAGTSMGAIIGGMYASGFSPDSIASIVTSPSFQNWALGTIEDEYRFFYKRPPENASWISLRFNVDSVWQHRLPTNLVSPVQMDFAGLQYLTAPNVVSGEDFDRLFIPFRCVAADIQAKEAVVFRQGPLYPAIRASMTYPFIFRPIRIDGRLLFDGGIYNNFPVDVMIQDFNPDVIIGSVVSGNVEPPDEDDIRSHLENMLVHPTDYSIPEDLGLVIRPSLPPASVTDFSRSVAFADSGYVAVKRAVEEIERFIERRISSEERKALRDDFLEQKPPLIVERIFVRGLNEAQREYVSRVLLYQGRPMPIEEIRQAYFKLIAEEHIEMISPSAVYNPQTGYYDLYLDVRLNNDLTIQFGGNISSSPVNFAFVQARYKHMGYQAYMGALGAHFSRFYNAAELYGRMDLALSVPLFIESRASFNSYDFFRTTTGFITDYASSFQQQQMSFIDLAAGIPVRYFGKSMLGLTLGRNRDDYYQSPLFGRTDLADRTRFGYFSPYLMYEKNTLNRKMYADRGQHVLATARFVTGFEQHRPGTTSPSGEPAQKNHHWWQIRASYLNYFTRRGSSSLGLFGELTLSNKNLFSNYNSSLLSAPAFEHVPQSRTLFLPRYRANNFAVLGLHHVYNLSRLIDIRTEAYVFQPFREIIAGENNKAEYGAVFRNRYLLISGAIVANTPIGPLSINLNYFDRHDDPLALSVNFGYLLFNRKPLQ